MAYRDFVNEIVLDLKTELPESEIYADNVENVQGMSYYGLIILSGSNRQAITIDLNPYFERMRNGQSYRSVSDAILTEAKSAVKESAESLNARLRDYDWAKKHIAMQLVSAEKNMEMLQKVPFVLWNDLAVIFRIVVDAPNNRRMIVLVTNELLAAYGMTDMELFADVISSAEKSFPAVMADAKDCNPYFANLKGDTMYVAECENCEYGASVMLYKNFMRDMAERFGGSFFIMAPTHESLILVSESKQITRETLQMLAKGIYESYGEQGLSGKLYHYDMEIGEITIVE